MSNGTVHITPPWGNHLVVNSWLMLEAFVLCVFDIGVIGDQGNLKEP